MADIVGRLTSPDKTSSGYVEVNSDTININEKLLIRNTALIKQINNNEYDINDINGYTALRLYGNKSQNSAQLHLMTNDSEKDAGSFILRAALINKSDSEVYVDLVGRPDHSLYWNRKLLSSLAMPSSKYTKFTVLSAGSKYTAPANGWVLVEATSTGTSGGWINLANIYKNLQINAIAPYMNQGIFAYVPVNSGDIFSVSYLNVKDILIIFVYANLDADITK